MTFNCHIHPECSEFTQAHGDFPPSSQKPNYCKRSYPIIQTKALVPGYPTKRYLHQKQRSKVSWFGKLPIRHHGICCQYLHPTGLSSLALFWCFRCFENMAFASVFSPASVAPFRPCPRNALTVWKKPQRYLRETPRGKNARVVFFSWRIGKHKDLSKISRRQSLLKTYHASN